MPPWTGGLQGNAPPSKSPGSSAGAFSFSVAPGAHGTRCPLCYDPAFSSMGGAMSALMLVELLADGAFHSGEELGAALGVSRAAVWKQLQRLRDATALP